MLLLWRDMTKKKKWIFLVLFLVNLGVILSFFYLSKKIRSDENLKINAGENIR
jgi:regulatory protein YycI of two-component signal transduction system YycFG